jgi:GntR family transcriptional regulator of arabinose operon
VPEELSVVSIDDSDLSELCKIKFTSYPHPKEVLGEIAAGNLLHMIEDPLYDGNHIFSSKPMVRDSVYRIA